MEVLPQEQELQAVQVVAVLVLAMLVLLEHLVKAIQVVVGLQANLEAGAVLVLLLTVELITLVLLELLTPEVVAVVVQTEQPVVLAVQV